MTIRELRTRKPFVKFTGVLLLFATLTLLSVLIVAVEVLVRSFFPAIGPEQIFLTGTDHLSADTNSGVFESDPLLIWRLRSGLKDVWWDYTLVSTNSENIRAPADLAATGANELRILCLGDSITFGYRIPVVFKQWPDKYSREEKPYCTRLAELVQIEFPAQRVIAIPLGVPGYTSYQGRLWLERDISKYRPDIVIANFAYNDTTLAPQEYKALFPSGMFQVFARKIVSMSSALMHFIKWRQSGTMTDGSTTLTRAVSTEDHVYNMLEIARIAESHRARVLLLGGMYQRPDDRVSIEIAKDRDALGKSARQRGVPFLEIQELTEKGWPMNEHLFGEPIHPSDPGHQLLAARIFNFLSMNSPFRE